MKKYQVTLSCTRFEVYEVEANSAEEAEDKALAGEWDYDVESVNENYEIENSVEI
jgi:hypothetical protein